MCVHCLFTHVNVNVISFTLRFVQGDAERMLGNPVFVAMDREKMGAAAKSQVHHALASCWLE